MLQGLQSQWEDFKRLLGMGGVCPLQKAPIYLEGERPNTMAFRPPRFVSVNGILGWIPEIVKLSQNRFRTQIRLLGLSALVGIVAGLGAIVF